MRSRPAAENMAESGIDCIAISSYDCWTCWTIGHMQSVHDGTWLVHAMLGDVFGARHGQGVGDSLRRGHRRCGSHCAHHAWSSGLIAARTAAVSHLTYVQQYRACGRDQQPDVPTGLMYSSVHAAADDQSHCACQQTRTGASAQHLDESAHQQRRGACFGPYSAFSCGQRAKQTRTDRGAIPQERVEGRDDCS